MPQRIRNQFIRRTVFLYICGGSGWIFGSDYLLSYVFNHEQIIQLSVLKGIVYILITGGLFFYTLHAVPEVSRQEPAHSYDRGNFRPDMFHDWPSWLGYLVALLTPWLVLELRLAFSRMC